MENAAPAVRLSEVQASSGIADLRDVPLRELPADADFRRVVRGDLSRQSRRTGIDVAAFSSAL